MIELIPYLIKSSIGLTICYGFYFLLLQKESTLLFNRIYLLGTTLFSLITPLITLPFNLPKWHSVSRENTATNVNTVVLDNVTATEILPVSEISLSAIDWLLLGIIGVSTIFLFRFIFNVARILYKSRKGEKVIYNNAKLVLSPQHISPHTFFKFIFLNKSDYELGVINNEILQHEKAHCDQLHTIDILFIELVKVLFWWHPIVWLYKRSMQLNHEYLADSEVLKNINMIDYQKAIIGVLEKNQSLALVSHFNYYSIKKRFIMMTKLNNNRKSQAWRIWLTLPVLLGLFVLTANSNAQVAGESLAKGKKEIKIELKGDLSEEEIDKIIDKELAKHALDKKEVDVNVESDNGTTIISINGGNALILKANDIEDNELEEDKEIRIIKIKKNDKDDVKWISKNDEEFEIEMEVIEDNLEFELENLDKKIELIHLKNEEDMKRKMEEIEMRLEEIGEKKEEIMEIIEDELMRKYEIEEESIFIKQIEIEEEVNTKNKKKKKRK